MNLIPYDAMRLRMEASSHPDKEEKIFDGTLPPTLSDETLAAANTTTGYVRKLLEQRISTFHSSVAWFRTRYYFSAMSTVVLSGLVTVIAGLKLEGAP